MSKTVSLLLFSVLLTATLASATCATPGDVTISGFINTGTAPAFANTNSYSGTGCTQFVVTALKAVFRDTVAESTRLVLICNANPCVSTNSAYMALVSTNNNLDLGVDQHDNVQFFIPINGGGVRIQFDSAVSGQLESVMMTGHAQ